MWPGCARTGSGVCNQTEEKSVFANRTNWEPLKSVSPIRSAGGLWNPIAELVTLLWEWPSSATLHTQTLKALGGWKLHSTQNSREKEMSGVALGWLMLRVLPAMGRRYPLADICPASLPIHGGSIGLNTSFEQSRSCMWQKRPSLLPPHYSECHKKFEIFSHNLLFYLGCAL